MATGNKKIVKVLGFAFCAILFALSPDTMAQVTKIPIVGFLVPGSRLGFAARVEAFRQGLRELGYLEGKNIAIEYRWSEGNLEQLPELAAELVRIKVD